MGKFDHQGAAFVVAGGLFWGMCLLAVKRFPSLAIYALGTQTGLERQLWRGRLSVLWVGYFATAATCFSHFQWTLPDTYKTILWFAIFTIVALLALFAARLFSWTVRRLATIPKRSR